jgi:hypothetical protein
LDRTAGRKKEEAGRLAIKPAKLVPAMKKTTRIVPIWAYSIEGTLSMKSLHGDNNSPALDAGQNGRNLKKAIAKEYRGSNVKMKG